MLPTGDNPIAARVASPLLADLLARGKSGGYPADIKLIYSAGGDLFNQCPNVNKILGALGGVECLVAQDNFFSPRPRAVRYRPARDHLLGAQRCAHAVGGGGALRDLHAAGD
jgi:hypothetical protein